MNFDLNGYIKMEDQFELDYLSQSRIREQDICLHNVKMPMSPWYTLPLSSKIYSIDTMGDQAVLKNDPIPSIPPETPHVIANFQYNNPTCDHQRKYENPLDLRYNIEDDILVTLNTQQLNKKIKDFPRMEALRLRKRRRQLMHRISAHRSWVKRKQQRWDDKVNYERLLSELECVKHERDQLKKQLSSIGSYYQPGQQGQY